MNNKMRFQIAALSFIAGSIIGLMVEIVSLNLMLYTIDKNIHTLIQKVDRLNDNINNHSKGNKKWST